MSTRARGWRPLAWVISMFSLSKSCLPQGAA